MKLNIVMVEPEIPQNTGNIARTCAITGAKLHLVYPLGFSLDDKRQPVKENDIPDIIKKFNNRFSEEERTRSRLEKSFFVDKEEIVNNDYDLSLKKYKERMEEKETYRDTNSILQDINELQQSLQEKIKELEDMLK